MLERQIVIVEDDDFLRSLIASYLEQHDFSVATARTAVEAAKVIKEVDPDALILDIDLGDALTGIDVARRFGRADQGVAVVFLTSISDSRFVEGDIAKEFPKASYLNKGLLKDPALLVAALEGVLVGNADARIRHDRNPERPFAALTQTQIQVLQLVASGKTNRQISELRGTSLEATEAIIARIMRALSLDSAVEQNARILAARTYIEKVNFPYRDGSIK